MFIFDPPRHSATLRSIRRIAGRPSTSDCRSCAAAPLVPALVPNPSREQWSGLATELEPRREAEREQVVTARGLDRLDRRALLKGAGIMTAVAAVRGVTFLLGATNSARKVTQTLAPVRDAASTQPLESEGAFGVDSCTSVAHGTVGGMPLQFYIGELGATQYSAGCFNTDTARHVAASRTHGYWGVSGPRSRPSHVADAAAFGQAQALEAIEAWHANHAVAGRTIFADVEFGFGGWGGPVSPSDNVALLDAFLRTVAGAGFVPGVYINESEKVAWFPAGYTAVVPFVYWVAGGPLAGTMPPPCHVGDTLRPVRSAWASAVSHETFGGMKAVIWQYWLSSLGCGGDFNFSPQFGNSHFLPQPA